MKTRKFCVSISGFKLLDPSWGHLFSPNFLTPTLHVIGTNDVVVVSSVFKHCCTFAGGFYALRMLLGPGKIPESYRSV